MLVNPTRQKIFLSLIQRGARVTMEGPAKDRNGRYVPVGWGEACNLQSGDVARFSFDTMASRWGSQHLTL